MDVERKFARALAKAKWHTYRDDESGRVVTNAFAHEIQKLEKLSGVACELVNGGDGVQTCARIGPVLKAAATQGQALGVHPNRP